MNDLNLIDPELSRMVRQRRAELWDACIARLEMWTSRLVDIDWSAVLASRDNAPNRHTHNPGLPA